MELNFKKYTGLGNDFIIVEQDVTNEDIVKMCTRRFGIGADGIIVLKKKDDKYFMKFFNADASVSTMCGNGIRCYTQFLFDNGYIDGNKVDIDTLAGVKKIEFNKDNNDFLVKVDMGKAKDYQTGLQLTVLDRTFDYTYVNTGVEHIVIYVTKEELNENFVNKYGSEINKMKHLFPDDININFVYVVDKDKVETITFERGVGLTYACGTGASAIAYVSNKLGITNTSLDVKLLGGTLKIDLADDTIFMTGISEFVYEGKIKL